VALPPGQNATVCVSNFGAGVTDTVAVPVAVQLAELTTVTLYVPLMLVVALLRVGFWLVEVKPSGPLQLYVAPPDAPMVTVPPSQAVKLVVEILGRGLTVTLVVAEAVQLFEPATTTEYVPVMLVVALLRVGFCSLELNPFGPAQV
jgi:hypothetical protein